MGVNPIPKGFHSVTPYLVIEGAPRLIDFLKAAFDGVEIERHLGPNGQIMHAEVQIGDSVVMMSEAAGPHPAMPSCLYHYVKDVDATYRASVAAGAKGTGWRGSRIPPATSGGSQAGSRR